MRKMENLEYLYILGELASLVGKRFEKAQELEKNKLQIKIGSERIVIELGVRLNLAYYIDEGRADTQFIQKIRKELKGAKLSLISQHNSDRIIVFKFQRGDEEFNLIFEMFAEGNAILELNGKTLSCYKREQWKDRETKSNSPYLFPQSNIKQSIFEVISDKYIISCMMQLPLGKKYAKEILRRLEIEEKTPGSSLCEGDLKNIEKEIEKLKKDLAPYGIYKEDKLIDYSLFEEENSKPEKPFSKLIDEFYRNPQEIKSPNLDKIERKLETQVKYLEELKQEEIRLREIGDKLYEKYLEVEEAIKKKQREVDL